MTHRHVEHHLAVQEETGRISLQIIATLIGGVLLACSFIAQLIYVNEFYPATLSFIAAVLLGAPIVVGAVRELLHGHMHMNELVALAVLASFATARYQEAGAIAFFMIISELIENRTALGAAASIESLVRITPTRATTLVEGQEVQTVAADLEPGDVVRVRPGDSIPADGVVLKGQSTVNQATITGESLPADKGQSDEVFSGTINLTGLLDITVTKAGQDTTLGKVKKLILQAEQTRIPIMRMIDEYAAWYTPTVLMLVGIVLFFTVKSGAHDPWGRAIAMLVVACPCALILATPTAMVAGLSSAARLGVLIKSVVDLEAARNLTAIVFDKTGTLTTGKLQVTRLVPQDNVDAEDLLLTAAAVEQHSRHPVARAVIDVANLAQLMLPEVTNFEEVPGRGVRAAVNAKRVVVGRAAWLTHPDSDAVLASQARQRIATAADRPEAEGLSLLFVVRDGALLGWIGLEDHTRAQAPTAIDRLREMGLKRLIMVTGDRQSVAKRVAAQMHTEYRADVLPHEKLQIVDQLKDAGHRVAVIGDGVNDAPALAAGDISIAMGAAGSDVAIHSANIALMNNQLDRIPFLIDLSRRTSAVIKQNMVIGAGFIVTFLAMSAANLVTPIAAAVLHTVSSLVVVFNSARLVRSGEDLEHAQTAEGRTEYLPTPAAYATDTPSKFPPSAGPPELAPNV